MTAPARDVLFRIGVKMRTALQDLPERGEHGRVAVRLPALFFDGAGGIRLGEGVTSEIGGGEVRFETGPAVGGPGDRVSLHLGPLLSAAPDPADLLTSRVTRAGEREGDVLAVEVCEEDRGELLVPELLGRHPAILAAKRTVLRLAEFDVSVLVEGDCGTGRSFIASLLHRYSGRSGGPLIAVSCPAEVEAGLDALLFGGAGGPLALADGGTLVLDEVAELPRSLQGKLLQVLEGRLYLPAGGLAPRPVRARIIATTSADLRERVARGRFRADLYYRLNVVSVSVPPLRERPGDVPLLASAFQLEFSRAFDLPSRPLAPEVLENLARGQWPGNLTELRNAVKRGILLGVPPAARDAHVPSGWPMSPAAEMHPGGIRRLGRAAEREAILRALNDCEGNRTEAAARLGVSYRTLLRRLKEYRESPRLDSRQRESDQRSGGPTGG